MDAPKRIHIRWGKAGDTRVTYMEERFFPPDNEAEYIIATEHARIVAEKDARIAELERLVEIGAVKCEQCGDPATTLDGYGDASCEACHDTGDDNG